MTTTTPSTTTTTWLEHIHANTNSNIFELLISVPTIYVIDLHEQIAHLLF